jgi:hypothetical protein
MISKFEKAKVEDCGDYLKNKYRPPRRLPGRVR